MSETHDETRKLTVIFEWGDRRETYTFEDKDDFVFRAGTVNVPSQRTHLSVIGNKVIEPVREDR